MLIHYEKCNYLPDDLIIKTNEYKDNANLVVMAIYACDNWKNRTFEFGNSGYTFVKHSLVLKIYFVQIDFEKFIVFDIR